MSEPRISVVPPLPLWPYVRTGSATPPFPFDRSQTRLFATLPQALVAGLPAAGLRAGDRVLVPAYHRRDKVEALVLAGLSPVYYDVDERLAPRAEELDALLACGPRALVLSHRFGFPQDAVRWRAWCDAHDLALIEGVTEAWLATIDDQPVGSHGDLALFRLDLAFGLPDGAALHVRAGGITGPSGRGVGFGGLAERHAEWLLSRSGRLNTVLASRIDRRRDEIDGDHVATGDLRPPAGATRWLLPRVADPQCADRRRGNYQTLVDDLGDRVTLLFRELPAGSSPFALPVFARDKGRVIDDLARAGVRAYDPWGDPHPSLPPGEHPGAARLRAEVIALPVHQELRHDDLERILRGVAGRRRTRRDPWMSITPVADLGDLRDDLDELAAATGNIFWTWDWISRWWDHFGREQRLAAYECRDRDGALRAILPLYYSRRSPFRVLRFVGHGVSDELGPIVRDADRPFAIEALRRVLGSLDHEVFLAELLPSDARWSAVLGGQRLRTTQSPVLQFRGRSWEKVTAGWSTNFRQQVGRKARKLEREHDVVFRRTTDPAQLDADLDTLFALHLARWHGDSSFAGIFEPFHRDFAHRALERGWLRLWVLEVDGRPAAALHGFRFGDAELFYQSGRDPEMDKQSVGLLLLTHTVRQAHESGASEYRFLKGDESYKFRLANGTSALETLVIPRGPVGAAAVAASLVMGQQPKLTRLGHRIMR